MVNKRTNNRDSYSIWGKSQKTGRDNTLNKTFNNKIFLILRKTERNSVEVKWTYLSSVIKSIKESERVLIFNIYDSSQ